MDQIKIISENTLMTLRKKRGLTQTTLAKECGLTPHDISRFEAGHRGIRIEKLKRIADVLSTSCDALYRNLDLKTVGSDAPGIQRTQPGISVYGAEYFRRKRRISRGALAKLTGLCPTSITKIERDPTKSSSSDCFKIASALNISLDELISVYPVDSLLPGDHAAITSRSKKTTTVWESIVRERTFPMKNSRTF